MEALNNWVFICLQKSFSISFASLHVIYQQKHHLLLNDGVQLAESLCAFK